MTQPQWQYEVVFVLDVARLNELGREGWEICMANGGSIVLKRRVQPPVRRISDAEYLAELELRNREAAEAGLTEWRFKTGAVHFDDLRRRHGEFQPAYELMPEEIRNP